MSSLFRIDGPLMDALRKFTDIVVCNIVFLLLSLPIVTMGAALTALHSTMQVLAADIEGGTTTTVRAFFRSFKDTFWRSTVLWGIFLLSVAFFAFYRVAITSLGDGYGQIYTVTWYALLFLFIFGYQYVFPLQARIDLSVKDTMKNAYLLAVAAMPWTLAALALPIAAVSISFLLDPSSIPFFIFLWAVCDIALLVYLQSFFYLAAMKRLGVKLGHDEESEEKLGEQTES